jgi:hypothetical protein
MPRELVAAIDKLVGRRARSRFLTEAAEEKVRRERLSRAMEKVAGSLVRSETPPEWETSEGATEWVGASRRADRERLDRLLKGR